MKKTTLGRCFRPLWLGATFLLGALSLAAPLKAQNTRNITFERFSTAQGLSNYTIRSLLQDSSGFLWIGTGGGGLNRYDGYTFTVYTADEADPADDYINALNQDHLGLIWIGTQDGGVYVFDPRTEQFTQYAYDPDNPGSLSHDDVQAIYEDRGGTVWIGTRGGGLNRFDRATRRFTRYRSDPGAPYSLSSDSVWAIHEAPSQPGVLWIGTERGLNRLELSTEHITRYPPDLSDAPGLIQDAVRSIYVDGFGVFWVGTDNSGLYTFRPGMGSPRQYVHAPGDPGGLASNFVRTIHEDRDGVLWIGTHDGGLNRFDRATERSTRYANVAGDPGSLPNNEVQAILTDRSGILWVGTWGGLGKHVPLKFTHYTHQPDDPNSLSHPRILSIYEDRSGVLWIGTLGGALNRLNRRTNRLTRIPLAFDSVIAICEDRSGSLWLGTRGNNLYHFDRRTARVTPYSLDGSVGAPNNIVLTIYEAPSEPGVLWLGTRHGGLYAFDVQTRKVIRHYANDPAEASSLSDNYAWPIYEDRSGVLWVGTDGGGLNRFNRETETFTRYQHDEGDPHSISSNSVISIHEDKAGVLWFGTFEGLNKFDRNTERFAKYTKQNGLPDNNILGILSDDKGHLWVSTNNGISRFNPQTEDFINYGVADGLQSTIFHIGATFKNEQGELFFGGENGFNILSPNSDEDFLPPVPPIVLTDFQLFGESEPLDSSITVTKEIRRPYDKNFITFEFAALDFTDPTKNQYQYKLDEVDKLWFAAGDQRYARYPDLAPGQYTFRVIGSNNNNIWNQEGASVRLTITPPWWRTYWAYAFYFIAGISIILGGYKARVQSLRARQEELTRLVEERTSDLVAEKKKTEEQAERLLELEQVKDEFFANISHEFRRPLTLILGPIQDALRGSYGPVSEKFRKRLDVMQRQGALLLGLINELLDLAKLEAGRMKLRVEPRNVIPFLKEIVLSYLSLAERRHVTLQFYPEHEHVLLYFDADKLEKIITNLLSNAFKFTPPHGKVRVNVREVEEASTTTTASLAPRSWVEISVKDTGKGIPPEDVPYIFNRFHQVDTSMTREHEGTGIGLALAKELVELHHGEIRVKSEEGFGTTFFVRLPLGRDHLREDDILELLEPASEEHAADDAAVSPAIVEYTPEDFAPIEEDEREAPEDAPTILIVEDHAPVREYLRDDLAELYRVVEATDGEEGLKKAHTVLPDLIISDVMMPKMDGYQLCRALKTNKQLNHIPIIMLTAKASEEDEIEGLKSGADDYIRKPFSADALRLRVKNQFGMRAILEQRYRGEVILEPKGIPVSSAEADFIKRVHEVVDANLHHSNFSVEWLAGEVALSARQLQRDMKKIVGETPRVFIRRRRLELAAELLKQKAGSIKQIAGQVGYNDPDYFSRVFREHFDVPPSKYGKNQT